MSENQSTTEKRVQAGIIETSVSDHQLIFLHQKNQEGKT